MKRTQLGALGLVMFASIAYAQTSPAPTETQLRDESDTPNRMQQDPNLGKRQKEYFHSIDHGNKGYLAELDVGADPWLSQNFARCDKNQDHKVTWQEYKECTRDNPAAVQRR
ncbi:MAG TPA: hypothetical protein VFB32_09985 [Rudaea sp.]|nr:hypothetical protein [Rudaea sp.]